MKMKYFWLLALVAALILSLGLVLGCGDDDDDDDDDEGDDDATDDDATDDDATDDDATDDDATDDDDDDDDDDDTPVPGSIGGTVIDFLSDNPLADTNVEALIADTGLPFDPAITGTTDDAGYVLLDLPGMYEQETVGVKASRGSYKDTVQFGFIVGTVGEEFLAISNTVFGLIAASTDVTPATDKGHVAGAVYWGEPSDETPIGCAEVTMDIANDGMFYASGILGLPGLDREVTTPGDPQDGEGTNPEDGVFTSINVDATMTGVTTTASADGTEETSFLPIVTVDTVLIQNVYYNKTAYPTNPQGAWCTSK